MDLVERQRIEQLADEVINAAKASLELSVSYEQRLHAYEFLEKVKDDPNVAIPCGFFLSEHNKEPQIRHLGLQFLEDTIKYHWNSISVDKKVFIKEKAMLLLSNGTQDILVEPIYIKDKVSRLIVEMMKREWPQQWPELLQELEKIANMGPTQAELVLLIFLRIAEDVATLQTLESNQRRRDLYQTFSQNMDSIFAFFFNLLELHYTKYCERGSDHMKYCRIIQAVFSTLTCFVEWVSLQGLQNYQEKLFHSMCQLISDQNIRQNAVECLLQVLSRKAKPEDRRLFLGLFTQYGMQCIANAANTAILDPLDERNYLFLKELTQVVATLGVQLCSLWGKDSLVKEPACLPLFLDTALAFSNHPSLVIYSHTNSIWFQLFKNSFSQRNVHVINVIPKWLSIAYSKMRKHGFPSQKESPSCQYSTLDFDSDDEYHNYFCKVRSDTSATIKFATQISPDLLFAFMEQHFRLCLEKAESGLCLQNDWDTLSHVVEKITSEVGGEKKGLKVSKERVVHLLRQCLQYKVSHPEIMTLVLTCISGLCVLIPHIPEQVQGVLDKLFECISFAAGQERNSRTKAIKNMRKHAASLLLRLCRTFPHLFMPKFEYIDCRIMMLLQSNDLSQLERVTLIQPLLILNSYTNSYDTQQTYIGKVICSAKEDWINLKEVLRSPSSLMSHVGLSPLAETQEEIELVGTNRSRIVGCVDVLLALLQRCRLPLEGNVAAEGGFVIQGGEGQSLVYRNPATPHVLALLPIVFCFLRTYNGLYLPESLTQLPAEYAKVHELSEDEKIALLGKRNPISACPEKPEITKSPFERLQLFLKTVQEHLCLILGYCGSTLTHEFYNYPHLADCLIHSVLWNFTLLPIFKIRSVVKFLKPLIEACPPEFYESLILPVVHHVVPLMLSSLHSRWQSLSETNVSSEDETEAAEMDKVVEDMMLRVTTRDYLEVICMLLTEKPVRTSSKNLQSSADMNGDFEEMDTEEADSRPAQIIQQATSSLLGRLLLRCDSICQPIVLTLLRALSWPDTMSCRKAIQPLFLCVQAMLEEGHQHLNEEAVHQIFTANLSAIYTHGQHTADLDALSDLAIFLYEKLRPNFPAMHQVLLNLPNVNRNHIVEFEMILQRGFEEALGKKANKQNKMKRDAFKKVVHNIIGKSLGETLKKDVQICDLQPIFRQRKYAQPRLDEASDDLSLCSLFGASVAD